MPELEWGQDYGPYKKGDKFVVNGEGGQDLIKSGILKVSRTTSEPVDNTVYLEEIPNEPVKDPIVVETATRPVAETADIPKKKKK